jgi:hypothetical protein
MPPRVDPEPPPGPGVLPPPPGALVFADDLNRAQASGTTRIYQSGSPSKLPFRGGWAAALPGE